MVDVAFIVVSVDIIDLYVSVVVVGGALVVDDGVVSVTQAETEKIKEVINN